MGWPRRHWKALLGGIALLQPLWTAGKAILEYAEHVEFISRTIENPGWLAVVLAWVLNPPPWTITVLLVVGIVLIWWDLRRTKPAQQSSAAETGAAQGLAGTIHSHPVVEALATKVFLEQRLEGFRRTREEYQQAHKTVLDMYRELGQNGRTTSPNPALKEQTLINSRRKLEAIAHEALGRAVGEPPNNWDRYAPVPTEMVIEKCKDAYRKLVAENAALEGEYEGCDVEFQSRIAAAVVQIADAARPKP